MSEAQPTNKWCGDPNCLQCVDKEPDPYVHLPREDYQALRDERDRLRRALEQVSFHLAQPGDDETPHNQYVPSAAEVGTCQVIILAALTPAAGGTRHHVAGH